jgi:hypothetical protein
MQLTFKVLINRPNNNYDLVTSEASSEMYVVGSTIPVTILSQSYPGQIISIDPDWNVTVELPDEASEALLNGKNTSIGKDKF